MCMSLRVVHLVRRMHAAEHFIGERAVTVRTSSLGITCL